MGRQSYKFEIITSAEPSEHPEDAEFLDDLRWRLRRAISDVQSDWPDRFIDTMGLDG
jgi:hypothetical protein